MRESYRATATAGTPSLESGGVRAVHMNPEGTSQKERREEMGPCFLRTPNYL